MRAKFFTGQSLPANTPPTDLYQRFLITVKLFSLAWNKLPLSPLLNRVFLLYPRNESLHEQCRPRRPVSGHLLRRDWHSASALPKQCRIENGFAERRSNLSFWYRTILGQAGLMKIRCFGAIKTLVSSKAREKKKRPRRAPTGKGFQGGPPFSFDLNGYPAATHRFKRVCPEGARVAITVCSHSKFGSDAHYST